MRIALAVALAVTGCGFRVASSPEIDASIAIDAPPPFCPSDPALRVCFSFDQAPLPTMLANEGAVAVDATLTDITRVSALHGGAAQLAATSAITLPDADVDGILALEIWFRIDTLPVINDERQGLVDSNTNPNISLFMYRADPAYSLRCGLGTALIVVPTTALARGWWHYAACNCEAGNLALYLDGTKIGQEPMSCGTGGGFVADGFTIGSDNNANPTVIDERLVGAIDGLRLWSTPLTPAQICERAGRTGC